jgi:IS605 OrfB family transposase
MKTAKAYTCKISGNMLKFNYLQEQLEIIKDLSWFIFNLKQQFGISWWFGQKKLYHQCRRFFPELNSKVIQNFIRFSYRIRKGQKLPKKPVEPLIIIDYQNFNFSKYSNKLTNYWLRFHRKNFPLFGLRILKKIKHTDKIQLVQIYKKNNNLYCKLTIVKELPTPNKGGDDKTTTIGCDVNYKRIVFSNNKFYGLKKLAHRKIEHKKYNYKKRNLNNYTKDFLHKLTTQISKDLHSKGVEVLVLENLKNLRKLASRKLKTSKGRMLNYIINSMPYSMFQHLLKYKCLDLGIKVEFINPAYTSKTCSRCGSKDTSRSNSTSDRFICNNCQIQLSADLNGSRNIEKVYRHLNALPVNLALTRT